MLMYTGSRCFSQTPPSGKQHRSFIIIIIIIIVTSFAPISSKIKLSGATKPGD